MNTSAAILVSAGGIWVGIVMMAWSNWQRGRADKRRAEAEDNRHKEAMQAARDHHREAMTAARDHHKEAVQEARDHHKEAMTALDTVTKALSVLIERTAPRPGA